MGFPRRHVLTFGCLLFLAAAPASAQPASSPRQYDLPPQELKYALRSVTRSAGLELYAQSDDLRGKRSPALHGPLTVEQALNELLAGSGLDAQVEGKAVFIRGRSSASAAVSPATASSEIVVTGSHIRGAAIASPTITMSAESIREAGQTSVGEAVRDLPQNFSGGQNPGVVGGGDQGNGHNLNSSSTIDLRGLGPDATLTLINGHRVAYDSYIQSVDVDQIPLAALDRIEIVADGASALYGSDAVAGVANILLKRDYDGVSISSRFGATTDGGDTQQQYDLTTGSRWQGGGAMVAFSVRRNTAIDAGQRDVTSTLGRDMTILPWVHQYGGVLTGHQDLTDRLHFEFDGIYNHRTSRIIFPTSAAGVVTTDGSDSSSREQTFSATPKLVWDVTDRWRSTAFATYGRDTTDTLNRLYTAGENFSNGLTGYHNSTFNAEIDAEGPLFTLPGGSARLAVGGGYRDNRLAVLAGGDNGGVAIPPSRTTGSRRSVYGFAELNLPLVSPQNGIWGIRSLSASAAVRYEDYPGLARLATPKLGIVYAPIQDLTLKASWGKSFKTPTLYQEHELETAVLLPSDFLASGAPAGSNVLFLSGGNPDLKPERATSWSATADLHPQAVPGLNLEFSYFHINYRDRVTAPITSTVGIFDNPIYQDLIDRSATPAEVAQYIARAGANFYNFTGAAPDPATIYAIIDDRDLNTAREFDHGFDFSARYVLKSADLGSFTLTASVSHIVSHRKLSNLQPLLPLAGTIFNAPHWRGHAGIGWTNGPLTITGDLTYIGGVTDNRQAIFYHVRGMAPVDLTVGYHIATARSLLHGIDLGLSVRNIQNVKPALIVNDNIYDPTYDSNNYSAIGRSVNLTVTAAF